MRATVLIPTHDHGALLRIAARSALRQSVTELEVLVVGDGVDEPTRAVARELEGEDDRVRFFDLPKGERLGELHRHRILLEEARGDAILYLSDDDLWLPEHAEHLLGLLQRADFAHALATWITLDGVVQATTLDLELPFHRAAVRRGDQTPGLTAAGHTREAYRRLPYGWRTTPEGVHTDSWMWRQFLVEPWCRAVSGKVPTFVHLPSSPRRHLDAAARLAELERYEALAEDPVWRRRYAEGFVEQLLDESAWFWAEVDHLRRWGARKEEELKRVWEERNAHAEGREVETARRIELAGRLEAAALAAEGARRDSEARLAREQGVSTGLRAELAAIRGRRFWRLARRLRRAVRGILRGPG